MRIYNSAPLHCVCRAEVSVTELLIVVDLRWPKRAIPSFPYGRTSILRSALPRFHTSSANCTTCCACAKHAYSILLMRKVCTNVRLRQTIHVHEVKSWMASNRQGPFLHLFALGYLLLSCALVSILYTSSCTLARFLKSSTLPAHT